MERIDGRIAELIEAGVMAGAYASLAGEMPEARGGLMKMYEKHHARVGALCGELARTAVDASGFGA